MSVAVSVVVDAYPGGALQDLIGSLDAQTLPTTDFELVVVDRGVDSAQRDWLRRLVERRPHVRLGEAGGFDAHDLGERVLIAHPQQVLLPDALRSLQRFAEQHETDVVVGRSVRRGEPVPVHLLVDAPLLDHGVAELDLRDHLLLARTDRLRWSEEGATLLLEGASASVFTSYPVAVDSRSEGSAQPYTVAVKGAQARWEGADLVVEVTGTSSGPEPSAQAPDLVAALRHVTTGLTFLLPSLELDSGADPSPGLGDWRAAIRISPLTQALGSPLDQGRWELDIFLSGTDGGSTPVPVPLTSVHPAILDGLVVVVAPSASSIMQIDVGPTSHALVRQPVASDASVAESSLGSVLRLALPGIHVQTGAPLQGWVALGGMRLPAKILTTDGMAVLTAFVSGLAGTSAISTKFGAAPMRPTGLSLVIADSGTMTVTASPPAPVKATLPSRSGIDEKLGSRVEDKPAAPKVAKKKQARSRKAQGPVARLRRVVPAPLEPAVTRLSRHAWPKKVYRRLTGLAR